MPSSAAGRSIPSTRELRHTCCTSGATSAVWTDEKRKLSNRQPTCRLRPCTNHACPRRLTHGSANVFPPSGRNRKGRFEKTWRSTLGAGVDKSHLRLCTCTSLVHLAPVLPARHLPPRCISIMTSDMSAFDVDQTLSELTLGEKILLLSGTSIYPHRIQHACRII